MGSQDQHRQTDPTTAAEARERAAALKTQADAADIEAGHYTSHELREQIRALERQARDFDRQERRAKSRRDDAAIAEHIAARRSSRGTA
ncbi:hypothetical protein [Streptomyces antibioticus]|uniref:hypothetical protein n=1 Tax=Streptomyces antibioticus TaxID=1890 RepID=UPI00369854EC